MHGKTVKERAMQVLGFAVELTGCCCELGSREGRRVTVGAMQGATGSCSRLRVGEIAIGLGFA